MFPDLFTQQTANGPVELHTWGLMLMVAFFAGTMVAYVRAPKVGANPDILVPLVFVSIFTAVLGSRLMHFLFAEPGLLFSDPMAFFSISQGGMAVQGGVICAVIAGMSFARWRGAPALKLVDVIAPSIALGQCLGRLGCFFAGCCHGVACPAPVSGNLVSFFPGGDVVLTEGFPFVALVFTRDVGVGSIFDVPTYPTQLWESFATFALFLFLSWMWKNARKFDGQILAGYMLIYPFIRSVIEHFRGDEIRGTGWFGFLSTGQVVSIAMFAAGLAIVAWGWRRGVAEEIPFTAPDDDDLAYD